MTDAKAAMQQALDALELTLRCAETTFLRNHENSQIERSAEALRAALRAEQPVAAQSNTDVQPAGQKQCWVCGGAGVEWSDTNEQSPCSNPDCVDGAIPPPAPAAQQPTAALVPLTDAQIGAILADPNIAEMHQGNWLVLPYAFARAIERAHGIGEKT